MKNIVLLLSLLFSPAQLPLPKAVIIDGVWAQESGQDIPSYPLQEEQRQWLEGHLQKAGMSDVGNYQFRISPNLKNNACADMFSDTIIIGEQLFGEAYERSQTLFYDPKNDEWVPHEVDYSQQKKLHQLEAILFHEREHIKKMHAVQKVTFDLGALGAMGGALYFLNKKIPASCVTLPQKAGWGLAGIMGIGCYLKVSSAFSQHLEKDADRSLKNRPLHARAAADFFENLERRRPRQASTPAKTYRKFFPSHPPFAERKNYLRKWAEEAESKDQDRGQNQK